MFFSEEKKQKTFASGAADGSGIWPAKSEAAGRKSLLLLFSRKEELSSFWLCVAAGAPTPTLPTRGRGTLGNN
jgi:hypothetical protein